MLMMIIPYIDLLSCLCIVAGFIVLGVTDALRVAATLAGTGLAVHFMIRQFFDISFTPTLEQDEDERNDPYDEKK